MDDDADPTEPLDEADPTEALSQPLTAATAHLMRASKADPALELRPGVLLRDRYLLGDPIARGGQAVVFRAQDQRRDPEADVTVDVAIKILRDDRVSDAAVARLRREFRQTQALQHPGALRMFDLDCERGAWFLCMELLKGASLRTRLKRVATQPLDVTEALRIASACADVLACAHRRGIPHGDVKPSNVFLEEGGGIRVLDFGAAFDIRPAPPSSAPEPGSMSAVATRAYASPEVLAGLAAEPRDDVFSLACVTYEMLAGRHPFGRQPANEARDRSLEAEPLQVLSPAQNAALARGLAWSRAERPASVEQWIDGLLRVPEADPTAAPPEPTAATTARRRRWATTSALAAVLALGVLAAWYVLQDRARGAPPRLVDPQTSTPSAAALPAAVPPSAPMAGATEATAPAPVAALPESSSPIATTATPSVAPPPPSPAAAPVRRTTLRIEVDSPVVTVSEKAAAAVVVLRRTGDAAAPVTVTWRLVDGSARAGDDYLPSGSARTRFQPGQSTRAIYVPLVDDTAPESEEFFSVVLSSTTANVGDANRVTITIRDDD